MFNFLKIYDMPKRLKKYIPKILRKHGDELKTEQQNSLVLNNYGTFDPKRKPLESIHD
jgi:hypothetical protein